MLVSAKDDTKTAYANIEDGNHFKNIQNYFQKLTTEWITKKAPDKQN